MKKKLIFLCITTLCVLLVTCVAFAACDPKHPAESGFKVTLDFNGEQGDVTLSKPAEGELYDAGEEVTVTVTPKEGWLLDTFTVSGFDDAALNGGGYTFDIQADTTVTVTFKKATFTVSLTATPADGGTAELSPKKDIYEYGDEVTLTMTPASDNVVRLTVNDQNIELTENEYKFTVKENLTIAVKFVDRPTAVLESLQGSIIFEGTRVEKDYYYSPDYPEETIQNLKTTFDAEKNAVLTEAYEGTEPMRVWLFQGDKDNNIVQITHNQFGSVQRTAYKMKEDEETGKKVVFSDLFNPFDLLTTSLLKKLDDNKWTIENAAARYNIANAILGYADLTMEYFEMYEENAEITKIKFAFDRVTELDWYEDYQYCYDIDVKEHGTASIDDEYFGDYPMTEAHDELKAAMESAAEATSYSVTYDDGYDNYTLYYTKDGIYYEMYGEGNGYVARPDGKVWSYVCESDGDYFEFDEATAYTAISELKAPFVFRDDQGEYYNLLKDMGEGKFVIRPADAYDSYGSITSFFKLQLATGEEQIDEFSSAAYVFAITIKDGKPFQMDFEVYGEPATLTFGDWNSATLPYQVPADVLNGKIDKAYSGSWASENGDTVLNIDLDKILFDGEKVDALTSLSGGGYSFTYDEKSYTIVKNGNDLTLTQGSTSTTLYNCPWAMYIGDFYQNNADVTIRANSIKVKFKGSNEQTATDITAERVQVYDPDYNYYYYVDQFDFKLGGVDYILQQADSSSYDKLVIAKKGEASGLGLYRDKYEEFESWEDYLGTYIGDGYTAKLESDKLTITFDDKSEQATDLIFYRDWDYEYTNNYYYQFAFKYDGKDCVLEIVDENTMLLVIDAKATYAKQVYLTDETYKPDYSPYYGVFDAYDYSSTYAGIRIEINENGVFITKEGKTETATIVSFSEDDYGGNLTVKTADETIYYISIWPSYGNGSLGFGTQSYGLYPVTGEAE